MTLSLPPFTRAVIWLLAANTPSSCCWNCSAWRCRMSCAGCSTTSALQPQQVVLHGWIWQVVTYSFIHAGFWHWFGNMIGIWMFGSAFEGSWGTRRFLELYSFGVVGAALTTIVLSFAHALGRPDSITVGASGGVFAILIAFGMVFGENDILMIPFPGRAQSQVFCRDSDRGDFGVRHPGRRQRCLCGPPGRLFFGYIYVKFLARKGLPKLGMSERFYSLRNGYYRWKRRRAARKFEVYMRKHDRTVTFDEQGNYIPPDEEKKNGGSKSGWVN